MAKLAIIVGHMERAQGARAVGPIRQYEYTWNKDLAEKMIAAAAPIENFEAKAFFRDVGGLRGAYGGAREWGADAAMELHFNAATPRATGTETLYYTDVSLGFARAVHNATVNVLKLRDRGVKTPHDASGGRGEQNLMQMGYRPSILTEPFFGSNSDDARRAHSKKSELARAQLKAAADYLLTPFDTDDDRIWTVTASSLNVRGGPGVGFEKQSWGPLKLDDEVRLISKEGNWRFIQFGDDESKRGYVYGAYLK